MGVTPRRNLTNLGRPESIRGANCYGDSTASDLGAPVPTTLDSYLATMGRIRASGAATPETSSGIGGS